MDTAIPVPDLARFTGRAHEAHRRFWADLAAAVEEPIRLPDGEAAADAALHAVPLSTEAHAVLQRISGGAEMGRLVVLAAAVARVLAAEGGGQSILVDIPPLPTAPHAGEALPVLLPLLWRGSTRDLLGATRDRIAAAFAHQDFPARRLTAQDVPEAPLLIASDALHPPGIEAQVAVVRLGTAGLRLRHPAGRAAALAFGARIDRALAGFADTAADVATIELLSAAEQDAVRSAGKGPPAYPAATIWSLFVEAAQRYPNRTALRAGGESLTYAALHARAVRLAAGLRTRHDIGRDALVGLVPARKAEWIAGILGIMAAGGAYLPLPADLPAARRDAVLAEAAPRVVLPESLDLDGDSVPDGPAPDDLAYVLYTSGSTGQPKGVMIAHAGFANMIRDQIATFGITPEDRVLQLAAASFDASLSEIFMALLAGATLVLIDEADTTDAARFTAHLAREGVTVATITPAHLAAFDRHKLPTLRVLITAGDAADPATVRFYAAERAVFNAYGPTEVSVCASMHRVVADAAEGSVPIGRPVAGSRIHVLDGFGRARPPGGVGEIVFAGPGVARGYLGRDSDAFPTIDGQRAYRTGDAGCFRADGTLVFLGRLDQQVKLRGHRVEPAEIAQALQRHPLVRDAHVAALRAPGGQTELAAYVALRDPVELWPSIAEFFVYDDLAYGAMAGDETRNTAYRAAFARQLPGKTVLEIGPGAEAVLSRMAIAAGARHVFAVEINAGVAEQARARLRAEGLAEHVTVITGDIATVVLPDKADVCISEIVGTIGGAEGSAVLIEASRRWLRDPSAQLPARTVTRMAGVTLAGLDELGFPEPAAAYAERIFAQAGRRFDLRLCLKNLPRDRILTGKDVLEDLDYRATLAPEDAHDIRMEVQAEGAIDGFLVWLHLVVDAAHPEEAVDILDSKGSWLPAYLPLDTPSPALLPGDVVVGRVVRTLCANGLNPNFRVTGSFRRGDAEIGHFTCASPHIAEQFRGSPLHRAAFDGSGQPRVAAAPAARLRAHLETLLPAWMMPSHIIPLDRLPLNASGKVDRKALPEPPRGGDAAQSAPRTPLEATLAAVIAEVLGLDAVGVQDDFFALGGDSIRAIQVAARLGAQGITLASTDILAARSIAAMVPHVRQRRAAAQGPSFGPFPPTPIQQWFLRRGDAAPHHFNQAMLLRSAKRLDPRGVAQALDTLAAHHDALRSRFGATAEIAAAEPAAEVVVIETTADGLAAHCADIQASLDLEHGPIQRAAILRLPDADRLLWVVHHLAMDWVSWRILLPDFERAYAAYLRGAPAALPPRSDGFADWARAVAAAQDTPEWQDDAGWWCQMGAERHAVLPIVPGEDRAGDAVTLSASLDARTTAALLRSQDAEMQERLLVALASAAQPLAGNGLLPVMVEAHGREALLAPLDVSRTVGWFTSFHPVAIPLDGSVHTVRAALRAVPRRGLGYLMQAARADGVTVPAQIGLNYLGRLEEAEASLLRVADESAGPATDINAARPLPVEILAHVADGQLHVALNCSPRNAATMQVLLDGMVAALATEGASPDTSLAAIAPAALDSILSDWD